jgi:hypothetical protein
MVFRIGLNPILNTIAALENLSWPQHTISDGIKTDSFVVNITFSTALGPRGVLKFVTHSARLWDW